MAPVVKKAASATILSFLGSSFIFGVAIFLMKDTIDRVNNTVDRVSKNNTQMATLGGSIDTLNIKIDVLNGSVDKTAKILDVYTRDHAKNLSNMTVSMVRVTEKLTSVDRRDEVHEKDIGRCEQKIDDFLSGKGSK